MSENKMVEEGPVTDKTKMTEEHQVSNENKMDKEHPVSSHTEIKEPTKTIWGELYSNTSLHGIRWAFQSKGPRRMFWLSLVFAALILACILFIDVLIAYLRFNAEVSKKIVFEFNEIEFPRVTICNVNTLSNRKIRQENFTHIKKSKLIEFYRNFLEHPNVTKDSKWSDIVDTFKRRNLTNLRQISTLFDMGKNETLNDEIVTKLFDRSCEFNKTACSKANFSEVFSVGYHGKCFAFPHYGSAPPRGKLIPGVGFRVFLNIQESDYLDSGEAFSGLCVFVHPFNDTYSSFLSRKIALQPGTMNFLRMTVDRVRSLPYPYPSACGRKDIKHVSKLHKYSKDVCNVDCTLEEIISTCNCTVKLHFAVTGTFEECQLKDYECVTKVMVNLHTNNARYKQCLSECPLQCEHVAYNPQLSSVRLGTRFLYQKLAKMTNKSVSESKEYIQHNIIGLQVTYTDHMYYMETMQPSVTWQNLLGTIGGTLGLCFGCSLVTIIEFLIFTLNFLWIRACASWATQE